MNDNHGFTLIELIAVLVIIGILTSFAVPKFFSVQEKAIDKTIDGAARELKLRVNQHFASQLLTGIAAKDIVYDDMGTNIGNDFEVLEFKPNGKYIIANIRYPADKSIDQSKVYQRKIYIPQYN